jgi:CRP-like cAMP-binding protein
MTTDSAVHPHAEALRTHPFFAGFASGDIARLAAIAKTASFGRNHVILREGEESTQLYLLTAGRVALEIPGAAEPFRVATLSAGDEFGWSWALGNPGVYQVRALEPVEALLLPAHELAALCDEDRSFGYVLMRRLLGVVSERLRSTRLTLIDAHLPAARSAGA